MKCEEHAHHVSVLPSTGVPSTGSIETSCLVKQYRHMILRSFLSPVTKSYTEKKLIQTHPLHLFRIICDVDRYASFLPLCKHSHVVKRYNEKSFDAVLSVGLGPLFEESYTSRVTIDAEKLTVHARSVESKLFDGLSSRWTLKDASSADKAACYVDFEVTMTVSDPLVSACLDQVLREVAGQQVSAFENRCKQVSTHESTQR